MTIRLSSMFEEHMKRIIKSWKSGQGKRKTSSSQSERPKRQKSNPPRLTNGAGEKRISSSKLNYLRQESSKENFKIHFFRPIHPT